MTPAALVLVALVGPAAGAFSPPSEAAVEAAIQAAHGADLPTRLRRVTEPFLGAPYVLSALGEGSGVDPDPRMRFDAFDCTTFVESAMALALADDLAQARALLDQLRYRDGKVEYLARRHFPEAEWIPELIRLGYLEDITRQVGGDAVRVEEKKLDPGVWHRAQHDGMPKLPDERIPVGTFSLDVWPLAAARAGAARIPPGTILHVVRADFRSVPVRVSHQGIVIDKDGKRYLRHAADRMYHSVVDEPLDHFFARMAQYTKWPVVGVHLTRVVDRRATAPAAP
jgi:hypothetical protein